MKLFPFIIAAFICHSTFAQRTHELAKVDSILRVFDQPGAPGLSIGIVENGQLVYTRGIGFADIGKQVHNSDSTIFGIASVAKQFTAACIWSLVQEGKISLDDDVRKYIPELPFYGETMRIRHMLNHTSGIRNYHALMDLAGFDYDKSFHDNRTILDLACRQKGLNNLPGEKVIYGNTAYTLLAIMIERITRRTLDEYAKDKIFRPLGMNHTFYRTDTVSLIPNQALGYIDNNGGFVHPAVHQVTYGAGSVCSTIEDLATWSNVLNGRNASFADLTRFLLTADTLHSGEIPKYARGVMTAPYRGIHTVHHSGYSINGRSQLIAVPDSGLAIIILANLETIDPVSLSYKILDAFLPEQKQEPAEELPVIRPLTEHLLKYTGYYQEQNSDMRMVIILQNDTLKALGSQGKKPLPLVSSGEGKFTRMNSSAVRYDFSPGAGSGSDLVVYFGGTPFYFSRAKFVDPAGINLADYAGHYFSRELAVRYEIYVEDGHLSVNYPGHHGIKLTPGQKDEFGNGQRVLYRFERNKKNKVIRLYLSAEGTVRDITFVKE